MQRSSPSVAVKMEAKVRMDTMPEHEPRARSASTLSRVFRPDPTEEKAVNKPSRCSEAGLSLLLQLQHPNHQEDPPLKYYKFWSFSFMIKLMQVLTTIVCAGLYTKGLKLICNSITSQMFPNIVFASYMLITPVILLSYVLGQKMPELLIRIFNVLGAILFFVAGTISLTGWEVKYRQFVDEANDATEVNLTAAFNYTIENVDEDFDEPQQNMCNEAKYAVMLLAEGVLSLFNACLYLADVIFSIRRTLSYL